MEVIIAPMARDDIASILAWTEENFGARILKRYAKLIATAIEQIAEDPERAGGSQRPEIAEHCRTYHLTAYALWREFVVIHSVQGKQVHDARLFALMRAHAITHILTLNGTDFRSTLPAWPHRRRSLRRFVQG